MVVEHRPRFTQTLGEKTGCSVSQMQQVPDMVRWWWLQGGSCESLVSAQCSLYTVMCSVSPPWPSDPFFFHIGSLYLVSHVDLALHVSSSLGEVFLPCEFLKVFLKGACVAGVEPGTPVILVDGKRQATQMAT